MINNGNNNIINNFFIITRISNWIIFASLTNFKEMPLQLTAVSQNGVSGLSAITRVGDP